MDHTHATNSSISGGSITMIWELELELLELDEAIAKWVFFLLLLLKKRKVKRSFWDTPERM